MAPLSSLLLSLGLAVPCFAACNADNCLRALRAPARLEEAQLFCATFTTAAVSAASAIPSYAVVGCTGDVASRVSSACTCIASSTPVTSTSSPLTTSTSISVTIESTSSAPTSSATGFPSGPKACGNSELSCHNTTVAEDLCCFNAPGGQLLQTQFWDTAPSTGPNNSWTLHGLWPDRCDGTYDANCDASREYSNITQILQSYGKTDLLAYMGKYWKDYQGNDESFWEHEWDKHGTCISTLEPSCYNGYKGQEEVVDYFEKAVSLFAGLDTYAFLEAASIIPSTTATYTFTQIQDALTAAHGFPVTISCKGGALDEVWYHYNVRGNVQTGDFVPTSPDGSKSSCPDNGIKYLPKHQTATPTSTTTGSIPTSTAAPYTGRGFLQAYTGGTNKGCLISAGTWYTTGTCAGYTAAASGDGFTLTSSKGPCAMIANSFSCAVTNTAGEVFTNLNGSLAYAASSTFYAAAIPTGSVQQKIYTQGNTTSNAVEVSFVWQGI
ncbi:hypothetical protein HYALB_00008135 [Hymenoscyphus albidus]|uniref:Ribonuclease T2-like n=1 Tax=Hymenoscyphus albidus TaxID=595503 RepID=A0A9N9LFC9_9HELO|nr:hypothetical protein HYALB_00008135 [Hymenoscyphus albidus]